MPIRAQRPAPEDGWYVLPGLFDAHEVVDARDFEVLAVPIVQIESRVLYGVYARERSARPGRVSSDSSRSGIRASIVPNEPANDQRSTG